MPINLKAKLAYDTFHSTYKNEDKIKENMVLVDNITVTSKDAALRATQEAADDPHVLSREENNAIAMNVMGLDLMEEAIVACRGGNLTMLRTLDFMR
ncbi:uncharacterized protein A4U43_C05F14950 [Asparagus officinalis]|uniref:Uncharacterized protein n=1 Tax=Asparagus officinalis TaxID=4686 RepID=A0A5P1ERQ1_ASPOF|nr:uncharacterized protein A4U43_C05F14950 [Asparagus officinalis]